MRTQSLRRLGMLTLPTATLLLLTPPQLASQDDLTHASRPQAVGHVHSPATAAMLGLLVPGAGHIYSHEYPPGVAFLIGVPLTFALGNEIRTWNTCMFVIFTPCEPNPEPYRTTGVAMMALAGVALVGSAIDAHRAAGRANAEHERAAGIAFLTTPRGPALAWRVRF